MRQSDKQKQSSSKRKHKSRVFHISQTDTDHQSDKRCTRGYKVKRQSTAKRHAGLNEYSEIA